MDNTHYKIRRISDGLFSDGSSTPGFSKVGNTWRINILKAHLSLVVGDKFHYLYKDCEIVKVKEIIEHSDIDLKLLLDDAEQKLVIDRLKGF